MNPLARIIDGVTDENVYKRIAWMYVSFFLLYVPVLVVSHYALPEGIFRGKHPIISNLQFSPLVWVSALQVFGYNLILTSLIIAASLLAQQSRVSSGRFVPIGYTVFWGLTVIFAVVTGSWSFDVIAPAPSLHLKIARLFNVARHAGLLEMTAYLLAAVTSFRITLWYSDRRTPVATRSPKLISLTSLERGLLLLAFVILACAAFVESRAIVETMM
jgi:hypothetical protein